MFGENPDGGEMNMKRWISYILSTFVINIVGLNLLISVISENYSDVNSRLNAIDCKARLEQILKVEETI